MMHRVSLVVVFSFFLQHTIGDFQFNDWLPYANITDISAEVRSVTVSGDCAVETVGDSSYRGNPTIPAKQWILTPRVVQEESGHYRVLGRDVHMDYAKELLVEARLNFDTKRKTISLINKVVILADKLFIKGKITLHGIRLLKVYAREIVASSGSSLDVSVPSWIQEFAKPSAGGDKKNGKHGLAGPHVEIYTDVFRGNLEVIANGANGHKGQDGTNGAAVTTPPQARRDKSADVCTRQRYNSCYSAPGVRGLKGTKGNDGEDAGKPGNGGDAGRITFRSQRTLGRVTLKSCRGRGAPAAKNGKGGNGGPGGLGGRGRRCQGEREHFLSFICADKGATGRARTGPRGDKGADGKTPSTPGGNGQVTVSSVQSGKLDKDNRVDYPTELVYIIKRQAEDVLLGDSNDASGRQALEFILTVASGADAGTIKKAVRLKLGFLAKPGYDIFGKNEMFAPLVKWQSLRDAAEDIKRAATVYEETYNGIKTTVQTTKNFVQVGLKMSAVANLQVEAERARLEEARRIATSEKGLYVRGITHLETQMKDIQKEVEDMLPSVYKKAKFNAADLITILQGLVGFANAITSDNPFSSGGEDGKSKKKVDPLGLIDTSLGLAGGLAGKSCLKSLDSYLGSIKKWLTFGANYTPLKDSSDLDFDKLDVASVPDIMQVNLEMNKEQLTAELVCLLDVASKPTDVAGLKQKIESFFIAGSARIDLIGKVMDLDNDIGGYNFDIPLLENTKQSITDIGKPADTPIKRRLQLNFMDYLLSTYREMERSFMKRVYRLHKAFRFRTLWDGNDPLAKFRQVATSSARATGRLNGILQLTDVLKKVEDVETEAVNCFTNNVFSTDIAKWTFDNVKNKAMFDELALKGSSKFTINIRDSCEKCYNIRLLKIYIELSGSDPQPQCVPANIHIEIRHLSGSFFRAGDGSIKQYRQTVGSFRNIKFNRFRISDGERCRKKRSECPKYCVEQEDYRWQPMCSHPLSRGNCVDRLLGEEECKSPFGTYELRIPVDPNLSCDTPGITNKNCKDLDLTKFTKMNVWTNFFYWPDQYPSGSDDTVCRSSASTKRSNVTTPTTANGC